MDQPIEPTVTVESPRVINLDAENFGGERSVKYLQAHPEAVYVGRPSKWGNPFRIGDDGDRAAVVARFKMFIQNDPVLMSEALTELRGKNLACWCAPLPCHADVLLAIANPEQPVVPAQQKTEAPPARSEDEA